MREGRTVTVLVADDQELFRLGLQEVLASEPGVAVVGLAADGEEAVARAVELAPDVALMDVRMPGIGGIEATRRMQEAAPSTRVVMLTASDEEDDLYAAVRAGANGYLLKDTSLAEVVGAVQAVAAGEILISPATAMKLLADLGGRVDGARPPAGPPLSERELEVLRLVAQGLTNREVASSLHLSENTVKHHVASILDKLHLRTRLDAAVYAVRAKLVDPS